MRSSCSSLFVYFVYDPPFNDPISSQSGSLQESARKIATYNGLKTPLKKYSRPLSASAPRDSDAHPAAPATIPARRSTAAAAYSDDFSQKCALRAGTS